MHDVCICSCVNDDDVVCISGCVNDDVFTAVCCLTVLMTPATLSHSKWESDRSSKVSRNKTLLFVCFQVGYVHNTFYILWCVYFWPHIHVYIMYVYTMLYTS